MAALAARAAGLAAGAGPRSLTLHYLSRPSEDEIEVSVEVARQGRSTTFLALAMTQGDRTVVNGLAVCGDRREGAPEWTDATPPALPAPDDCLRVDPARSGVAPLVGRYDMRIAVGEPDARPVRVEGWIRTARPRPIDGIALAAMSDAFIPPAFFRAGQPVAVPTLELTIHFRGEPPAGEHPFVATTFVSRFAGGGVVEADGELWSEDGRLLAQSRQLALLRPVPAA